MVALTAAIPSSGGCTDYAVEPDQPLALELLQDFVGLHGGDHVDRRVVQLQQVNVVVRSRANDRSTAKRT